MKYCYALATLLFLFQAPYTAWAGEQQRFDQALDGNLTLLQSLVQGDDKAKLAETRLRVCPHDFTEDEISLLNAQAARASETDEKRRTLDVLCDPHFVPFADSDEKPRNVSPPKLNQAACLCIQTFEGDISFVKTTRFPPENSHGCTGDGRYIACDFGGVAGEAPSSVLSCPRSCLSH